jgi:hypothetical protein
MDNIFDSSRLAPMGRELKEELAVGQGMKTGRHQ